MNLYSYPCIRTFKTKQKTANLKCCHGKNTRTYTTCGVHLKKMCSIGIIHLPAAQVTFESIDFGSKFARTYSLDNLSAKFCQR